MPSQPSYSGPDICALQAHEVVALLKAKDISPAELLNASFARIDATEAQINATPTLCQERAYEAAKSIPHLNASQTGWLAGLPLGIKDLDRVKGVRTTYGTKALADHVPEFSDHVVTRLESRGGIVVGKTNTPEMGAGGNTFNEVFGHTRNPWNTNLNPAGSSGGAAAALATGQTWLSQGSDHGGSLRTPAAYCGVVGLRPTPGRVPGTMVAGASAGHITEGVLGPMARSVRDCALMLDAMAGFTPEVPLSFPAPETPFEEAVIHANGKPRIAFAPDLNGYCPVEPVIRDALAAAMSATEAGGATVVEDCPDLTNLEVTYRRLRGFGQATSLSRMSKTITRHFKPTLRENWESGKSLTLADISEANIERTTLFLRMQSFLTNFDVLACPVVGCMPRDHRIEWIDEIEGERFDDYMSWLKFAFLATTCGLPAISVPVGLSPDGMPIGLQLIGPPRGEAIVLAAARAVEIAVGGPMGPIDPVTNP